MPNKKFRAKSGRRNAKAMRDLEKRYASLIATVTFNNLNKFNEKECNEATDKVAELSPLAAEFLKIAIKQNQKFTICATFLDEVFELIGNARKKVTPEEWVTEKETDNWIYSTIKED